MYKFDHCRQRSQLYSYNPRSPSAEQKAEILYISLFDPNLKSKI
ncbi:hypothetical protein [Microseira wollei]|nr:hypothetical protein [Microseira wollei]